jgi:hypothetical protein
VFFAYSGKSVAEQSSRIHSMPTQPDRAVRFEPAHFQASIFSLGNPLESPSRYPIEGSREQFGGLRVSRQVARWADTCRDIGPDRSG